MSTDPILPQAQAAHAHSASPTRPDEEPGLQDVLAEKTLAMIGGAPKGEVQRLQDSAQARLGRAGAAASGPTDAPANATNDSDRGEQTDDGGDNIDIASTEGPDGPDTADSTDEDRTANATDDSADANPEAEATPPASAPTGPEMKDPERFRFQKAEDRAVAQIAKAKGISLVAAARIFAAEPAPTAAEMASAPDVAQLEAEVAELERRLEASGTGEGLWSPQVAGLVKQHSKAAAALEVARLAGQHAAQHHQAFETQRQGVLNDAVKQYPDLGDRDSALWKVAAQLAREAHDPEHPDHQAGQSMDAPRYFAEKAADLLRMKPSAESRGTAAASQKPASRPGPAPGSRQTLPAAPAPSLKQRVASAQAKTLSMIGGQRGRGQDDADSTLLVL